MAFKFRRKKGVKAYKKIIYRGQKMSSKAEVNFAMYLDDNNIPWMYEPEVFDWIPPKRKYTPDFKIMKPDGSYFYVEYKGYLRVEDKTKLIAIKKQYPSADIRLVFTNANGFPEGAKPRKDGTKMTNKEWADRYGFPCANKIIPERWLQC